MIFRTELRRVRRWLEGAGCALALLVLLPAAQAGAADLQRDGAPQGGSQGGTPGAFDYYLMSFTIAPSFCASARYAEKQECRQATDAGYRRTPLTVHGLWPNRERVSVNLQPQYCAGPPLGRLSPGLRDQLRRVMPGVADGLDQYEWRRHGACSGLDPEAYFAAVVQLADRADATIGAALRDGGFLGQVVRIDDLLAGIAAKDPAMAPATVISCRFVEGAERRADIQEIRVVLDKALGPRPAETVGFGQNSGCPSRAGYLPDGFPHH